MKFSVDRKAFLQWFSQASSACNAKGARPIFKYVLCEVSPEFLFLTAHSGETSLRLTISGQHDCQTRGRCLMDSGKVGSLVKELTGDRVEFAVVDGIVHISSGRTKAKLQVPDSEEFPAFPTIADCPVGVSGVMLEQALRQTMFACDTKATRYALGGVLFHPSDKLQLVATDTKRMTVVGLDVSGSLDGLPENGIVPIEACKVLREIARENGDIQIGWSDKSFYARTEGLELFARLLEGRFPSFLQLIPHDHPGMATVLASVLDQALRQVQVTTNVETMRCRVLIDDGSISISTEAADLGTSESSIPVTSNGHTLRAMFSCQYLRDFLSTLIPAANVELRYSDGEAALLMSYGAANYVIMPMALEAA